MFDVILVFTALANAAFILGWRFNRTGPLFAGLLLGVLCYRNSWSMIYHTDNLIVWHVLILGLTRFGGCALAGRRQQLARSSVLYAACSAGEPEPSRG